VLFPAPCSRRASLRLAGLLRLLLRCVFLRQILRLLLVLLFQFLCVGIRRPLMLRILLLLKLLPLLGLFCDEFVLLLLIFLVRLGVS